MSAPADFLGRLASRALGQAPPLAPRPAEPFEGPAGLAEEAAEGASLAPADSPRPTLAVPMDSPLADSLRSVLADPPESPSHRARAHPPETPALEERNWARTAETPALKGRNLKSLGLQPQVNHAQGPLRPEGAVPVLESLPSLSVPGSVPPTRSVLAEDRPRLGLRPEAPQAPPLQDGTWSAETRPTESIDEISPSSLTPRAALEPKSLALADRNQAAPRAAAPAAEPVIRVTIGRIEVRATVPTGPAAPAPPAARPAAPRLGLAEYLRRRGEGRP